MINYGDTGTNVKDLQNQLNTWGANISGFTPLKTDGVFGNNTLNALKQFQTASGIKVDGIYGNQTAGAFKNLLTTPTTPTPTPVVTPPPAPTPTPTPQFTYDPLTDPLYQAQAKTVQSQIAQQMAARGILGSTIDQERTAQSLGALGLQFRGQALDQFNTQQAQIQQQEQIAYERRRQDKQDAWTTAQERGYFNNDEARLWGLEPGTKTSDTRAREAAAAEKKQAEQRAINNAKIQSENSAITQQTTAQNKVYTDTLKTFPSIFTRATNKKLVVETVLNQLKAGLLTAQQAQNILMSAVDEDGTTAWEVAEQIYAGTYENPSSSGSKSTQIPGGLSSLQ